MKLKRLICSCCGGDLIVKDEKRYLCPYCKSQYEKDNAEEMQEILSSYLEQDKLERLSNARRVLYDAAIKSQYPSEKKVVAAATNVLSINPDDSFAQVVSYSYEEDGYELANLLPNLELDKSTADQIYRWVMRDVTSRQVGPMSDFIQRHFEGKDLLDKLTKLENEAEKEQEGFYLSTAPRDVFMCYSSKDMPEVIHIMDILEENGYTCFAAFRNLRHGRGAKENYLNEIQQAIESCKMFVFVSSKNSRSPLCDAIRVELPYLTKLEDKPRIEFMLDKDDGHVAIVAKKIIKEAFPTQERVQDDESLVERVEYIEKTLKAPKKKKSEIDLEEFNKKQKALDEKLKALEEAEARRKAELEEAEAKRKAQAEEENKRKQQAEAKEKEASEKRLKELEEKFQKQLEEKLQKQMEEKASTPIEVEAPSKAKPAAKKVEILSDAFKALGKYKDDGTNIVEYGAYPQNEVKEVSLIKKLDKIQEDENGYVFLDGQKYAKFEDNYYSFAPIRWIVIGEKENDTLLLSEKAIDVVKFDRRGFEYKDSDIREFLKTQFKNDAMFSGEKAFLSIGNEKDQISLLTKEEYHSLRKENICNPDEFSNYSKAKIEKCNKPSVQKFVTVNTALTFFGKDFNAGSTSTNPLNDFEKKKYSGLRPVIRLKTTSGRLLEEARKKKEAEEEAKRKAEEEELLRQLEEEERIEKERLKAEAEKKAKEEQIKRNAEGAKKAKYIINTAGALKLNIKTNEITYGLSPTKKYNGVIRGLLGDDYLFDCNYEHLVYYYEGSYFIFEPIHWYAVSYDKKTSKVIMISKDAVYANYYDSEIGERYTLFPSNGKEVLKSISYPSKEEIKKVPYKFGINDLVKLRYETCRKYNKYLDPNAFFLSDVRTDNLIYTKKYKYLCDENGKIVESLIDSTNDHNNTYIRCIRLMVSVKVSDRDAYAFEVIKIAKKAEKREAKAKEAPKKKEAAAKERAKVNDEARKIKSEEARQARMDGSFKLDANGDLSLGLFPISTSHQAPFDNPKDELTCLFDNFYVGKRDGNVYYRSLDWYYDPSAIKWIYAGEYKGAKLYVSQYGLYGTQSVLSIEYAKTIAHYIEKYAIKDKSKLVINKDTNSYVFLPTKEMIEKVFSNKAKPFFEPSTIAKTVKKEYYQYVTSSTKLFNKKEVYVANKGGDCEAINCLYVSGVVVRVCILVRK